MNLNLISSNQSNEYHVNTTDMKIKSVKPGIFSINKTVAYSESINFSESNSLNIWEELSTKYNVRKATRDEIHYISQALYAVREISDIEYALLTFNSEKDTNYLKQSGPATTHNRSKTNGKRDWIAEVEENAAEEQKCGNLMGYISKMKILNILQRLE